jgi:hypothetical protein
MNARHVYALAASLIQVHGGRCEILCHSQSLFYEGISKSIPVLIRSPNEALGRVLNVVLLKKLQACLTTDRIVSRHNIRVVSNRRSEENPSGLLVAEYLGAAYGRRTEQRAIAGKHSR